MYKGGRLELLERSEIDDSAGGGSVPKVGVTNGNELVPGEGRR